MTIIIADRRISKSVINDQRERIQANIEDSHKYFYKNYKRYHEWRNFLFKSSLGDDEIAINNELGRPNIQFNICEAYQSRLLGEFANQEPNLKVGESDSAIYPVPAQLIEVVEKHVRSIIFESNRDNMEASVYAQQLSGGFGVMEVYTDYQHEMSTDQNIYLRYCPDPTLVGFDKMAMESHKGDGMFCYKSSPKNKEELIDRYGSSVAKAFESFSSRCEDNDYQWVYRGTKDDVAMVVDYWEKKIILKKIVKVRFTTANGQYVDKTMTTKEYEKMVNDWAYIMPHPAVVGKEVEKDIITICRHRLVKGYTIEYAETDFKYLPLIFADGNSVLLRGKDGKGPVYQMTRPFHYNLLGVQKLKNFLGTMIANHAENLPQSQWVADKKVIPEEYEDAWKNPQTASLLIYDSSDPINPDKPLPPPFQVQSPPLPAGLLEMFMSLDSLTQMIVGSYDASLGINNNQLSGKAMAIGAMQSNPAAAPFGYMGFIKALNRAGEIILDLIPKYYTGERTISLRDSNGNQDKMKINGKGYGDMQMDYDPLSLKIKIEAGVNFEIQRMQALAALQNLMTTVPPIAQFITTQEAGIEMLLDNYDIRGIDSLKQNIKPFVQQLNQQQQQAQQAQQMQMQLEQQQAQMQNKILELQAQAPAMQAQQKAAENQIKALQLQVQRQIDEYNAMTARLDVMRKMDADQAKNEIEQAKTQAEDIRTAFDMAQQTINQEQQNINI